MTFKMVFKGKASFLNLVRNIIYYKVFLNGKYLGEVVANVYRNYGYIQLIYIDKNYRRRGLGTNLLSKLENQFIDKGVKCIFLIVEDYNSAKEFYKVNGFIEENKLDREVITLKNLINSKEENGMKIMIKYINE